MASWEISSLEFAFILPAFLVLLMGTIDVARYLYTVQALVGLMGEAGRVAIMAGHPDWPQCPNQASNWWPQTATIAPLLDANNVYLCITPGGGSGAGPLTMSVQVSYPFVTYTPFFGKLTGLSGLNGQITELTSYTY